jgi:hypothetical protein
MLNPQRERDDLEQLREVHEHHDRHCARYRKRNWHSREYARVVRALRSWRQAT